MDRHVVEAFRSAVAVMTAFVDQHDEDEARPVLPNDIANQYVDEEGTSKLITGFVHLSMWLMQNIKNATGDEMETTLQKAGTEAGRLLNDE
jgi:hypothetical protein